MGQWDNETHVAYIGKVTNVGYVPTLRHNYSTNHRPSNLAQYTRTFKNLGSLRGGRVSDSTIVFLRVR